MIPANVVGGTAHRSLKQIADPFLQHLVGRKADRVLDPVGFQELVDLWHGEGRVSTEIGA